MIDPESAGLGFSVLVGWAVVGPFQRLLELWARLPDRTWAPSPAKAGSDIRRISPALTGIVERVFFTLLVAFDLSGVPAAMIGWIAAKMAANWNTTQAKEDMSEREILSRRFSALITGMVSLTIALLGGLIWKGKIAMDEPLLEDPFWAWMLFLVAMALSARAILWYSHRRAFRDPQ